MKYCIKKSSWNRTHHRPHAARRTRRQEGRRRLPRGTGTPGSPFSARTQPPPAGPSFSDGRMWSRCGVGSVPRHPSPAGATLSLGNGHIVNLGNKHLGPFISNDKWRIQRPKRSLTGSSEIGCEHSTSPLQANASSRPPHVTLHGRCWRFCS